METWQHKAAVFPYGPRSVQRRSVSSRVPSAEASCFGHLCFNKCSVRKCFVTDSQCTPGACFGHSKKNYLAPKNGGESSAGTRHRVVMEIFSNVKKRSSHLKKKKVLFYQISKKNLKKTPKMQSIILSNEKI